MTSTECRVPSEEFRVTGGECPALRSGMYPWIKSGVEWTAALVMIILAAPIALGLAILVKSTSEGPVFYSQMRLGRFGKPFRIYKLRTMTHRCEAATGPVWSVQDDPRITTIGRWLRDTHLDELPQLWNVLRGEMSLIGPRPERPEIAANIERVMPEFRHRLLVRPGITGLAQMRLEADANLGFVARKLAHDLQYVRHVGPTLDARIAASTVLHSIGWAATAASRRVVQRFAPLEAVNFVSTPPVTGPDATTHKFDPSLGASDRGSLSRAA
jgi:lipopolysaccharide/colanic/teichoic acid biosynthesis glycosyltransferase